MEIVFAVFFFIFGTVFGSFFNVVGLRVPKNEPFGSERSMCPSCKQQLSWYELLPIVSFMIQGGKCRHCQKKISFLYPTMEFITGILFAFCYIMIGFEIELVKALLLVSLSMILIVSDITYMLIPNKVLLFFLPLFIIVNIIDPIEPWWSAVVGSIAGVFIIAIIILASKGGMGAGDMKLFGLLGILLGIENVILTLILSSFLGAMIGMSLVLLKIIKRRQPIPFRPYILTAAMITYFYGNTIIDWYFNLL